MIDKSNKMIGLYTRCGGTILFQSLIIYSTIQRKSIGVLGTISRTKKNKKNINKRIETARKEIFKYDSIKRRTDRYVERLSMDTANSYWYTIRYWHTLVWIGSFSMDTADLYGYTFQHLTRSDPIFSMDTAILYW